MVGLADLDPPYFSITNSLDRYTLRLHRRLREIAGFRAATLPGLEHTLAVQSASGSAARGKCFTMKLTSEHRGGALRRSGVSAEHVAVGDSEIRRP